MPFFSSSKSTFGISGRARRRPKNNATGGTITTYSLNGKNYRIHSFLSNGNFVILSALDPFDIVYVGAGGSGGAGGGNQHGAGGNGGYGAQHLGITLSNGTYPISIGQPNGGATTGLGYTGNGGSNGAYMGGADNHGSTNGPQSSIRDGVTNVQYGRFGGGVHYNWGYAAGPANTGQGGGGGHNQGAFGPGPGGSGIFVIRYEID